jgi:uncharacterized protein YqfA (UPF0365 family)
MNSEHVNGVMESDDILRRGQDLAQAIVAAAEKHVTRAQANLDRAKSVADIILAQTNDEVRRINTKTANDKAATEKILEGYRIIEESGEEPTKPARELESTDAILDDFANADRIMADMNYGKEIRKLNSTSPYDGRRGADSR